jgi:hypothetical protein
MYNVEVIGAVSPDEIAEKLSAIIKSESLATIPPTLGLQETSTTEATRRDSSEVLRTSEPVESPAAALIEQTISSLEKKTPPEESNSADELLRQARLRVEQVLQPKPPDEVQSTEEDEIIRRAREKMKHLMASS